MSNFVFDQRRAGVVLHPTSLPGPHGSGDFGPDACRFIDWLHSAGQTLWQTLPLGPIGPGDSPYMGSSAFAGNPLLVAFEPLLSEGWVTPAQLNAGFADLDRCDDTDPIPCTHIHYPQLVPARLTMLRAAFDGFLSQASAVDRDFLAAWSQAERSWLDDYALFMALDQAHSPAVWTQWPSPLALRDPRALAQARVQYADEINFWQFVQWQFELQWSQIKVYANDKGIGLVGDLPIFVAHHSADCWARPDLYELDSTGHPRVVAGVPPDFFSATGQRWGNPLYNWSAMRADGYRWWIDRVKRQLKLADVVRIDHFRGFVDYWEIPADRSTAEVGQWRAGPGDALFDALKRALGPLPIIAEDLGIITPEVTALRVRTGFPGMRVLEFAFGGDDSNTFLPHHYEPNSVVYTGTHDNDTVTGWWQHCSEHERAFAMRYLNCNRTDVHWAMIRAGAFSVANMSFCQFQDILGLDSSHRMNTPGTLGCWSWRFKWSWIKPSLAAQLAQITSASGR